MANLNHLFKKDNNYYIVDGKNLSIYRLPYDINEKLDKLTPEEISLYENKIKSKSRETFQIQENYDGRICKRLVLVLSNFCNLACKYCYAQGGNYNKDNINNMSLDILKQTIKNILDIYPDGIEYIQFFGGEPLLNTNVMIEGIKFINSYFEKKHINLPKYTIVTNGTLIDDDIIDVFDKYFSSVTISLDGEKSINDINRVFKLDLNRNDSVYDKVVEKINIINSKKRNFSLCLEVTVTPDHIRKFLTDNSINSINCLRNLNVDVFQISPVFHKENRNFQFDDYKVVRNFFDKWVIDSYAYIKNDNGRYLNLGNILKAFAKKCYIGNNCGAILSDLAIDTNGDIYPCFMFIGYEDFKLTNSKNFNRDEYINRRKYIKELLMKANDNEKCNNCWANKLCADSYGHCIGSRYLMNGKINEPIDLACEIGKTVIERTIVSGK